MAETGVNEGHWTPYVAPGDELTFGTRKDIERELRRTLEVTRECPGLMLAIGNHLPANIPLENALHYFELVEELGRR
ncbi:MAG: hypothetical protein MUQ65_11115 [Armatimonadetes bacterium]|nr:hypothetical protein [Armatimonadota bacterium]